MSAGQTTVDVHSLRDFDGTLRTRLDQAGRALLALTTSPGCDSPPLGGFHDALHTAARHQVLHDEYVERLRRLVDALVVVRSVTAHVIDGYRTVENLNSVGRGDVADAMRPVGETLHGGEGSA